MFPNTSPTQQLSKNERKLCKLYKSLNDSERQTLLSFAEFLNSKHFTSETAITLKPALQHPTLLKAADNESVVKGIKRLKSSYFMIDNEDLLHEISALMSEHIMKGVSAKEIIPKIEAVFDKFYQQYQQNFAKEHQDAE